VEQLGEKAGKDLMSDIAGVTMSKWTPEGLGKYFTSFLGGAEVLHAISNPASLVTLPATALAASPRVVGGIATNLGKIAQKEIPTAVKAIGQVGKAAILKQNATP
jgi:hypothetical protein